MRVVLDTNVVVSRYLSPLGPPARLLFHWERGAFELAVSGPILAEYSRVLAYPQVRARHGLSDREIAEAITTFRNLAVLVEPSATLSVVIDDPSDNRFLECAVTAGAEYVVSGDVHLLRLGQFEDIQILRPAEFLSLLEITA